MEHQYTSHTRTTDDLLDLIANRRCRAVLSYFRDASTDVASVEELASEISKQDHGGEDEAAIQLHHSALPRLSDDGIVEYDPRSETVRYRGDPRLETLLDCIETL